MSKNLRITVHIPLCYPQPVTEFPPTNHTHFPPTHCDCQRAGPGKYRRRRGETSGIFPRNLFFFSLLLFSHFLSRDFVRKLSRRISFFLFQVLALQCWAWVEVGVGGIVCATQQPPTGSEKERSTSFWG